MIMKRKLAASVNYTVFGTLIYNSEKKKLMFLKEVDFVGSMSTKMKFILIHNFPKLSLIVKPIRHKVSLCESSSNFIPRLKDFIDVNSVFRY